MPDDKIRSEKVQRLKDELFGDMLSTAEVAEILDVHPRTVGDYIREGRLRGIQIGGGWRVPETSLREFVAGLSLSSPPAPVETKRRSGLFDRFVDLSRETVRIAAEEARSLKHNYIGTEHLLLALLSLDSPVSKVFAEEGVTHTEARSQIIEMVSMGNSVLEGMLPFTPRSKKVLEMSMAAALRYGHNKVRPEHIALALIEEWDGIASQVAHKLGNGEQLRLRLDELLAA